jgi:hypothetical protein
MERRSHPRVRVVDEMVRITWQENETPLAQLANVANVSQTGLGLYVDFPIAIGTILQIFVGDQKFTGMVTRHGSATNQHLIGVQLTQQSAHLALERFSALVVSE